MSQRDGVVRFETRHGLAPLEPRLLPVANTLEVWRGCFSTRRVSESAVEGEEVTSSLAREASTTNCGRARRGLECEQRRSRGRTNPESI